MMNRLTNCMCTLAIHLALSFLIAAPAMAQEQPSGKPSATIIDPRASGRLRRIRRDRRGNAELRGETLPDYRQGLGRRRYRRFRALRVRDRLRPSSREDLAGGYGQIREGWALGDQGAGTLWLKNDKGVAMKLHTQTRGLQLALGADGVIIGFK